MQTIDFINKNFANAQLHFAAVTPVLSKAILSFSEQACAEVHLQGAHLSRWQDATREENIFTSQKAIYQPGVPIRGGNPIIFPQFGAGEICQHGFARNSLWRVVASSTTQQATTLTLELTPADISADYRQQWRHDFLLMLTISLSDTLLTQMKIVNPNPYPLAFTHGFHTYLRISDIQQMEIIGLSGLQYMDNLRERAMFSESRESITVTEFIDRRYQGIPETLLIKDHAARRVLQMQTENCRDAFVWNPWREGSKNMVDLAATDYQKFICVEPGNMNTAVVLAPGQAFITAQHLKILSAG